MANIVAINCEEVLIILEALRVKGLSSFYFFVVSHLFGQLGVSSTKVHLEMQAMINSTIVMCRQQSSLCNSIWQNLTDDSKARVLFFLIDELVKVHKMKPPQKWKERFDNYLSTMPSYYAGVCTCVATMQGYTCTCVAVLLLWRGVYEITKIVRTL